MGKFWHFWGLMYRPFYRWGPNVVCYSRPTVFVYLRSFVWVYSVVLWRRKTPIFAVFWTSAFSGVANWQQSEKVEHGCTTTDLPLSIASKSFLYSNAFVAKSGAQTLTFKSVTNRQTDKQKTQRFWQPRQRVKSETHQSCMVTEDLEHVLAPRKHLRVWRIVSPLGGAEIWG